MEILRWIRAKLSIWGNRDESPHQLHELIHKADVHLRSEEYELARPLLLEALELPESRKNSTVIEYVLLSLEATWILTEKFEDAIAFFSDYLERYPGDSIAYHGRAGAFWYSGCLEEAIQDFSRRLESKPREILSLSGRGQVLAEVGRGREALKDLDLALQELEKMEGLSPEWEEWFTKISAFARNGHGAALAAIGENGPAMAEFE